MVLFFSPLSTNYFYDYSQDIFQFNGINFYTNVLMLVGGFRLPEKHEKNAGRNSQHNYVFASFTDSHRHRHRNNILLLICM